MPGDDLVIDSLEASTELTRNSIDVVDENRQVATQNSLQGGGDLSADRTISLVGDSLAPGNLYYYGTDGTGVKGFHLISGAITVPLSQEAGDLVPADFSSSGSPSRQRATITFTNTYTNPRVVLGWDYATKRVFAFESLSGSSVDIVSSSNSAHSGNVHYHIIEEGSV